MTTEDKRGPGLRFPPLLLVLATVGCAWLANLLKPLPIVAGDALLASGFAIIAIALLIALIALAHFFEANTHVEPWHPTTAIIRKGVYRFSRNPIYLSFCLATVGAGLAGATGHQSRGNLSREEIRRPLPRIQASGPPLALEGPGLHPGFGIH
jgi:protein-S-isoprenylcysteine O-methyltransferase Ste14